MEGIDRFVNALLGSDGLMTVAGFIAKSTLLLAAALLAQRLWSGSAPAARHVVLRSALLGVWLLTLLLPVSFLWPSALAVTDGPTWTLVVSASPTVAVMLPDSQVDPEVVLTWLGVVWLAGCLVAGVRYIVSCLRIRRIANAARVTDSRDTEERLVRLASDLGLKCPVTVRESPEVDTPIVWGIRRPLILLPPATRHWTSSQMDMVLRHELAHVKRYDIVWLNLASAAAALHWFNPLMWALRRALRQAGEYTCDDYVLSAGVAGPDYATHLLETAVEAGDKRHLISPGVVPGGNFFLEERIMSVLSNHKRVLAPSTWLRGSLAGLTIVLVATMAMLSVGATAGDESPQKPAAKSDTTASEDLPGIDDFVAVDVIAEMTYLETTEYPAPEMKQGLEGTVWIKALVKSDGTVAKAVVHKTSGVEAFDLAALKSAPKCRFEPAQRDGKPVAMWVVFRVEFQLGAKGDPAGN